MVGHPCLQPAAPIEANHEACLVKIIHVQEADVCCHDEVPIHLENRTEKSNLQAFVVHGPTVSVPKVRCPSNNKLHTTENQSQLASLGEQCLHRWRSSNPAALRCNHPCDGEDTLTDLLPAEMGSCPTL